MENTGLAASAAVTCHEGKAVATPEKTAMNKGHSAFGERESQVLSHLGSAVESHAPKERTNAMPSAAKPASTPPSSFRMQTGTKKKADKKSADGERFTRLLQGEHPRAAWGERRGRIFLLPMC